MACRRRLIRIHHIPREYFPRITPQFGKYTSGAKSGEVFLTFGVVLPGTRAPAKITLSGDEIPHRLKEIAVLHDEGRAVRAEKITVRISAEVRDTSAERARMRALDQRDKINGAKLNMTSAAFKCLKYLRKHSGSDEPEIASLANQLIKKAEAQEISWRVARDALFDKIGTSRNCGRVHRADL